MTRIGCLHAHHSNIAYIDQAIHLYDIELMHFVDPGLMKRITVDHEFDLIHAQQWVIRQLEWISKCDVDAILITCTNYIAVLPEDQLHISVPIVKIDEPLFAYLCNHHSPQILLFTNPETVDGTMQRLRSFAESQNQNVDIEAKVIENIFPLIMQGKKEQYEEEISKSIKSILSNNKYLTVSVGQLSMVKAAQTVEQETQKEIGNPLKALAACIDSQLRRRK